MNDLKLLTQSELIRALAEGGHYHKACSRTIHKWIALGLPPRYRPGGKARMYVLADVLAWLDKATQPTEEKPRRRPAA